jgi:uncharacterized protein (TIGR02246 family)
MEFGEAVDLHLAAIAQRDPDAYLATVHDDVALIAPNGKLLAGRDEMAAFHRDWFADPDWRWDLTALRHTVAGDTGIAVLSVDYHDLDSDGAPYSMSYVLSLVFVRSGDSWLLLHDQNTLR